MIRRRFAISLVALITLSACQATFAQDLEHVQMSDLIAAKRLPNFPEASTPNPDKLIAPPGENQFFPIRSDGQPFVLNEDMTINWTDALNRYYFNPRWRGEVWSPFPNYWIVERGVRMMPTWPEYDQFSILRVGNGFHKFFERWSGYGP